MRTPRIYVEAALTVGQQVRLEPQAHHHIVNVLRYHTGQSVVLFNGRGGEYAGTLTHVNRSYSVAAIARYIECHRESQLETTLLQGIARQDPMDYALQKAVELGVSAIQPLLTERCAIRLNNDRMPNKYRHWQSLITAACEQSGRTRIPSLHWPLTLNEGLITHNRQQGIVLDVNAKVSLANISSGVDSVSILVGPEGGLSESELALAEKHGFIRINLGPRILRTETAGVAALSAIQMLWGDLGTKNIAPYLGKLINTCS
jgi:16S rRNA (uracil1498-N3)-methyltransferase